MATNTEVTELITYYGTPDYEFDALTEKTNNKTLSSTQVDKNFNTLEGRDVKDFKISDDNKSIIITLYNGKELTCDNLFDGAITDIEFEYDEETGKLIYYKNGDKETPYEIGTFVTKDYVTDAIEASYVYSDASLAGNGTVANPLRISPLERTGMYKPINSTTVYETLPTDAKVGDRYIQKTKIDKSGCLYNYDGVVFIIKYLEFIDSAWKVARKVDWDDMLNALEPIKADRTHGERKGASWLGNVAGAYIKSDEYGFNVNLCGYANSEKQLAYYETREGWWTASHIDEQSAYIKIVDKKYNSVLSDIDRAEQFYSVRLVRDITVGDKFTTENIMGYDYNVVAMPSVERGQRLWINVNFNSDLSVLEITDEEGTVIAKGSADMQYGPSSADYPLWAATDITYICENNGDYWTKKQISDYDSFLCKEDGCFYYSLDGELVPVGTVPNTVKELEEKVNALTDKVTTHETNITALDDSIKALDTRVKALEDRVTALEEKE